MSLTTGRIWAARSFIGDVEPPATAVEDISRFGNDGSMTTAKPDWVQLDTGLWVLDFNGTDAVVDVGAVGQDMQTVVMWIFPDDITTRAIADFDGGTHSIEIDGSGDLTATGWSSPTFYTNGVAAAVAQTVSVWQHIAVTTATPFAVSDFDLGKEASFFQGDIAFPALYSRVLSAQEISDIVEEQRTWLGV